MMPLKLITETAWKHESWALEVARRYPRASALPIGSLAFWPTSVFLLLYVLNAALQWAQTGSWPSTLLLVALTCAALCLLGWVLVVAIPRTIANLFYVAQLTKAGRSAAVEARIQFLKSSERENLV